MQHLAKYRNRPPMLDGRRFLTDGGLETTLVFHEGWELPSFESFRLLESAAGIAALRAYFDRYVPIATANGWGFVLESPTWRANPDWGTRLGYDLDRLERLNRAAIGLMEEIRHRYERSSTPMPISANVGPRGDGYDPGQLMSVSEAADYHAWQIGIFRQTAADLVSAFTMTNVAEALGFAQAAARAAMPAVISFTVETDGRLPTGQDLGDAICEVDAAGSPPLYYMINCAHPTHFRSTLAEGGDWVQRIRGLRANSSCKSHAELDSATELDTGDPAELGRQHRSLMAAHPHIAVLGGCCGTDHRHVHEIGTACLSQTNQPLPA